MRKTLGAWAPTTIALAAALLLAGCKKSESLVGKWNAASAGSVAFEFKDDKSFTMSLTPGTIPIALKGEYALEGDRLTLTPKDVDAPGASPEEIAKAKKNPVLVKPRTLKVQFVSGDEVSLTPASETAKGSAPSTSGAATSGAATSGAAITLTRVKEGG